MQAHAALRTLASSRAAHAAALLPGADAIADVWEGIGSGVDRIGQGMAQGLLMGIEQHPRGAERPFARLRRHRPILVLGKGAIVTKYDDVQEVFARPDVFTVRMYPPRMETLTGRTPLMMDDTPEYWHDAAALSMALPVEPVKLAAACPHAAATPVSLGEQAALQDVERHNDMERLRREVNGIAEELVAEAAPAGMIDAVRGLTNRVPVRLCAGWLGTPGVDEETQIYWARTLHTEMFFRAVPGAAIAPAAKAAAAAWRAQVEGLMARRRALMAAGGAVPDDVLGRLLAQQPQTGLSDDRIRGNLVHMMVGFIPQMLKTAALALEELLRRPDALAGAQQAARDGNDPLLGAYVWEALRFNAHPMGMYRQCRPDVDYVLAKGTPRATRIRGGTMVFAALQSAMFDDDVLDQPLRFKLDRPWQHYLFFGLGQHRCLGEYVGRMAVPLVLKPLLRQRNLSTLRGPRGRMSWDGPWPDRFVVRFDPA